MFRALIAAFLACLSTSGAVAQTSAELAAYDRARTAMQSGDWRAALATAEGAGPVARDIIEWHRLRQGLGDFDSVLRFLARRGDWPGLKLLRQESETALPMGARADEVIAYFAAEPPQTGAGALALIAAFNARGQRADAEAEAVRTWLTMTLSAVEETELLAQYSGTLEAHHETRLDMLLWRDARQNAERMYPLVGKDWQALAKARLALRSTAKGVDGLVAKVPNALAGDPGLAFERMQWRARKGRNDDAIGLILDTRPDALGKPEYWAGWRKGLARAEMRAGRTDIAYRLASGHGLREGSNFAELEWLAGYIALTYKKDGKVALGHFLRFRGAVETPISLGRAGYWEGRAHELLGDAESARLAFAFGAEYQTSFYGLLAAERAGLAMDPELAGTEIYPSWRTTSLAQSSVFSAARIFMQSGEANLAEQFLRHLAEHLAKAEIGSLGDYLLGQNAHHLAVMVGKEAAQRGIVVARAYYPVASLGVADMPVPRELTLSIARRESEFDAAVVSSAGARGLMQLMPGTARAVAKYLGIPYSQERLIADPAYNARLGTAYLDELMETFDGNMLMVAAGYNAGPGRPIRWMNERGDPRRGGIDVVDWIEHIPFDETRNYVMRVAESLPVYRALIAGRTGPLDFADELVARPGHRRLATKGPVASSAPERLAQKGPVTRPMARPEILTD